MTIESRTKCDHFNIFKYREKGQEQGWFWEAEERGSAATGPTHPPPQHAASSLRQAWTGSQMCFLSLEGIDKKAAMLRLTEARDRNRLTCSANSSMVLSLGPFCEECLCFASWAGSGGTGGCLVGAGAGWAPAQLLLPAPHQRLFPPPLFDFGLAHRRVPGSEGSRILARRGSGQGRRQQDLAPHKPSHGSLLDSKREGLGLDFPSCSLLSFHKKENAC